MSVRTPYGERIASTYIPQPAASTSNPLSDGWAYSAADAIITAHNVHHLEAESFRHLVGSAVSGNEAIVKSFPDKEKAWNFSGAFELINELLAADDTAEEARNVPWTGRGGSSIRFGPFPLVFDRLHENEWVPRRIRVRVQADRSTESLSKQKLHIAISGVHGTPWTSLYALNSQTFYAGPQHFTADLDINTPGPRSRADMLPCRGPDSAGSGSAVSAVVMAYLWVGWELYHTTPLGDSYSIGVIDSVSAWEIPWQ